MRRFFINTIRSLGFICGLLALLLLSSQIVKPKGNSEADGMQDPRANGILGEAPNTVDLLFLGDSESYSAFMPLKLWKDYGITSYVCGSPGQKLYYTHEFLRKTFETQSPKVVILETNCFFRNFSYAEMVESTVSNLMPVFRYHDRWKSLNEKDLDFFTWYSNLQNNKGYVYSTVKNGTTPKGYMHFSKELEPISDKNLSYLEQISAFCRAHGAKLIWVSTPSTKNWNTPKHNTVQKIANELEIPYVDMNIMRKEIPIDWKNDTRDKGDHLNFNGALKVTDFVGKYLSERYALPDHREDPRFKEWDVALQQFNKTSDNALGYE